MAPKWFISILATGFHASLMLFIYYCERDFYSVLYVLGALQSLISYSFLNFQVNVNIFRFKSSHLDVEIKCLAQGQGVRHCQTWDCII